MFCLSISPPPPISISLSLHLLPSDFDECSSNNGGCEQRCVNSHGSFRCMCQIGKYVLAENGRNCAGTNRRHYTKTVSSSFLPFSSEVCNGKQGEKQKRSAISIVTHCRSTPIALIQAKANAQLSFNCILSGKQKMFFKYTTSQYKKVLALQILTIETRTF